MEVCLGIYVNVFTLTHAFGFDSLRSKWNAPIFLNFIFLPTNLQRDNVGKKKEE
jgi:hypothetical protein